MIETTRREKFCAANGSATPPDPPGATGRRMAGAPGKP